MSEHTPGPWYVSPYDYYTEIWKDYGDERTHIATADDVWMEAHANARLIAAAPELLEALEMLVQQIANDEWFAEWSKIARAAIAKARGTDDD